MIRKYNTKKGVRYGFTEYIGIDKLNGRQIIVTKQGFKTKKEAESYIATLKYEYDRDILHVQSRDTFRNVYDLWIKLYADTVKESTLNKVLVYFRIHILPTFGEIRIDDIKPIQCQKFANELSKKFTDYRKVYSYATRVFDYAYKIQLTEKQNPFLRVVFPKNNIRFESTPFLEKHELFEFLDAMKKNQKWYTFFRLLAFTGMRRGEALALNWNDVDFNNDTISITKTLTLGINNTPYISDTPKTAKSRRIIDVDHETMCILKEWKTKDGIIILNNDSLLFPSNNGNTTILSKPYQFLKRIIKENGFRDITVHSFRHTHCSMLFEAGWSIKDVQERLGHKDMKTTMDIYTHVSQSRKKESMKKFIGYVNS
ncbi:MAG: site-specific integrase [Peptoniphilaceae bacterium]|nr:site-specific integrase [Peptoniphilaceae bacterium]MDY3075969.1 site-specific integrase [Peptoniphilaceae bacterium]